ncbi:phosphatase PAP2 family protein [Sutcliffiella rhizosphaerae]|uniref:Phosphatidic acid phosphatase type 2/haloperoxidase domain-containing protein n=1 Tax=Sutcliffiella rhizosphaerae TaxID=2880967 RepID=A0ABM8YRA1_9BACI|nr:phosphatase PAP2 family protein [Sutcliffiella rhizosphaerae]CAG9622528.1 hypothetical protein BACCIP111883_03319 [Sutcliffiella rhizosphaerae]
MEGQIGNEKRKYSGFRRWSRLALFISCGGFFLWSFFQVVGEQTFIFDDTIRKIVNGLGIESIISFFHIFTMLGDKEGVIIILLISLALIWWRKRDYAAMGILVVGVIIVNELNKWLKDYTGRERPMTGPGAESLSFPSGHAMIGIFFYGLLLYLLLKYMKEDKYRIPTAIIGALFIFLLGVSRIFLNYHYPSDVLAGYAIGYICLVIGLLLYEWIYTFFANRPSR